MKHFRGRQVRTTSAAEPRTVELSDADRYKTVEEVAARELEKFEGAAAVKVGLVITPLYPETRDL